MKHVLIATPLYPPQIGGPATHVTLMEKELPKVGFSFDVLPYASVRRYPKGISHMLYFLSVWRKGRRADVIYVLDALSVGFPVYLASKFLKIPYVLRLGGDQAWEQGIQRFGIDATLDEYLSQKSVPFVIACMRRLQTRVAKGAYAVVAPSLYLKKVIQRWGVDEKNIVVAYSAPEELPTVDAGAFRKHENIRNDALVISSIGRLVPWKGFKALIDAFKKFADSTENAYLLIAGDGPEKERLVSQIAQLGLESRVRLLGPLPRREIAGLLTDSDIFLLNTRYEGFSHQLIEAFMTHTPVITTAAGGNAELIEDGVNGLLVPFNDVEAITAAIARVSSDTALRHRLTQEGNAKRALFDAQTSISTIVHTLKSAI